MKELEEAIKKLEGIVFEKTTIEDVWSIVRNVRKEFDKFKKDVVCIKRKQLQDMIDKLPAGERHLRFTAGYIHAIEKVLGDAPQKELKK